MLYTAFIFSVEGAFDRLSEEDQQKAMAMHKKLQADLKARGAYYGSARLMPSSTAMHVTDPGNGITVTDGPFAETKEQLAGIYMFSADTVEEAVEITKGLPTNIARMELRPVMWSDDFKLIT